MYPILFTIGDVDITSFGLMMFLSFIAGAWVTGKQLERYALNKEIVWDGLAWVALGGILGAKLYYLALHPADVAMNPLRAFLSRGGLVWYGGLIGGVLAWYLYVRSKKLPVATMFDATAPALFVAYAVGRMGCFLVGDDYGVSTDSWVGIAFPEGTPETTAGNLRAAGDNIAASIPDSAIVAVHPTQLYEIGMALILFAVVWQVGKRRLHTGQLFSLFMVFYGIERFIIEFVRAKTDRVVLGLSTSQLASILLFAAGIWLWHHRKKAPVVDPGAARPLAPERVPAPAAGRTA